MRIGIFGGSFDPVHLEHIEICKRAVQEFSLDKLIVVPTYISPHKQDKKLTSSIDRLNMLHLAFDEYQNIEVSDYEIKKEGVSYTFETILHFKEIYPNFEIVYLMGLDNLKDFDSWKNPKIISDNAVIGLVDRLGDRIDIGNVVNSFKEKYNGKVELLEFKGTDFSSTKIRVYNKLGLSLNGLTTEKVIEYITTHDLYREDNLYRYVSINLPEKRRIHTAGVILTGLKLYKAANVDKEKAEIVCLLHDVAKYMNYKDFVNFSLEEEMPDSVIHQYLGEYVARNILGVQDEEILNGIRYHTTGREKMTNLEKLVFTADLIEPSRTFKDVEYLREKVYNNFEEGFKTCIIEIYKFLLKDGKSVYHLTKEAATFYGYKGVKK